MVSASLFTLYNGVVVAVSAVEASMLNEYLCFQDGPNEKRHTPLLIPPITFDWVNRGDDALRGTSFCSPGYT